jgi:ribosomal-protein-alanine N-acetyltransferase
MVRASRTLHRGWVSPPATETAYLEYLKSCRARAARGFFVCLRADDSLAGVINLSQIARGNFQSAYLGFYAFKPAARQGYMTEALGLVLDLAFGEMKLHRLEANIQPANTRSLRLVKRLGFQREGFSPKYLKISGRWRDHERWAILAEDWRARKP